MPRRPKQVVPHREMFRVGERGDVIATPCTCTRTKDHWYAQPMREAREDGAPPGEAAGSAGLSRGRRRSPGRAGPVS